MTIKFTTGVDGYAAGTTVTLNTLQEAAYVARSVAVYEYGERVAPRRTGRGLRDEVAGSDVEPALFRRNSAGAIESLVDADGNVVEYFPAAPNSVLSKYSATAFDITRDATAAGFGISVTSVTHSISNERSRWGSYSRKVVIGSTASEFKTRSTGVGAPLNIFADPTDKAFTFSIFLAEHPTEFNAPNNPYITIYLSNFWSGGSNQSRWTLDPGFLRQGWNLITLRADDVVGASAGLGDMPAGITRNADLGTGFDWNGSLEFVNYAFNNLNGATVYIDQVRRAARANPVFMIGFDAVGAFGNDDVLYTKVAPLFAKYGIKSYVTMTYVYDMLYAGGAGWERFQRLHRDYGWEAIPHSWSHGATTLGANLTLASLVFSSDVGTATTSSPHSIPLGRVFRGKISGGSITAGNGVWEMTASGASAITFTASGAGTGTSSGTVKLNTFLSEVFAADNAENRRLLEQELTRNVQGMRGNGYSKGAPYLAYPNNSIPHLDALSAVCANAGIKIGRGARGGYTFLDELGIDNPLDVGSFIMDSGVTLATKTSYVAGKGVGAVTRGCHLQVFGHFILDDEDPANAAYKPVSPDDPPGINGNPAPPGGASQSGGGWWYLSQLRTLIEGTIGPLIASGQMTPMAPSQYVRFLGL